MKPSDHRSSSLSKLPSRGIDPLLSFLVDLASDSRLELKVKLIVHGLPVSGHLITLREYANELGAELARSFGGARWSLERMQLTMRHLVGLDDEETSPDDIDRPLPKHIHLRDAKVLTGSSGNHLGLWRAKLRDVSAFSLEETR